MRKKPFETAREFVETNKCLRGRDPDLMPARGWVHAVLYGNGPIGETVAHGTIDAAWGPTDQEVREVWRKALAAAQQSDWNREGRDPRDVIFEVFEEAFGGTVSRKV